MVEPGASPAIDVSAIDGLFATFDRCEQPGAAVGIAVGGCPVYRKGFGLASMELPVVLTPSTRMRIASVSKHFACLAYLLLCEDGKAALEDPVSRVLPELHAVTQAVTMRHLMGHVSGLSDAVELSWIFSGTCTPVRATQLLAAYERIGHVNAPPGTGWSYNNGGYLILSAAIERISGQRLEAFLEARIFRPAGLFNTALRRVDTNFEPNSATLHTPCGKGCFERATLNNEWTGEGGIVSTVDDMLRWLAHMASPCVGTLESWTAMTTADTLANGTSTGYGLGLVIGEYRGLMTISHSGLVMGGTAHMLRVPDQALDIVILANRQDVPAVALVNRLIDLCLFDGRVMDEPVETIATGTFRSGASGKVVQLLSVEGQQIVSNDGSDLLFTRAGAESLQPVAASGHIKRTVMLGDDSRTPNRISFNDFGNVETLHRLQDECAAQCDRFAGRYRSETTGIEVAIVLEGDGLRLVAQGWFGGARYLLDSIASLIWRIRPDMPLPLGGVLTFAADGQRFTFSTPRTHQLIFERVCEK